MNTIPPKVLEQLANLALEFEPAFEETYDSDRFTLLGHLPYEEAGERDLLIVLKELSEFGTVRLNSQVDIGSVEYGRPTSLSKEGPEGYHPEGWAIELHIKLNLKAEVGGGQA